jgi:GTP-binding protein Era
MTDSTQAEGTTTPEAGGGPTGEAGSGPAGAEASNVHVDAARGGDADAARGEAAPAAAQAAAPSRGAGAPQGDAASRQAGAEIAPRQSGPVPDEADSELDAPDDAFDDRHDDADPGAAEAAFDDADGDADPEAAEAPFDDGDGDADPEAAEAPFDDADGDADPEAVDDAFDDGYDHTEPDNRDGDAEPDDGDGDPARPDGAAPGAAVAQPAQGESRCGFVGIIGAPNAGKSTLTNALVGTKVSIVSHKVQTTRAQIRGIALHGPSQIIIVDTPGIFRPKRRLDRAMVDAAWGGAREADAVVVLIDAAKGLDEEAESLLRKSAELRQPCALALNKIDRIAKAKLLALAGEAAAYRAFDRVFMISALEGDGVDDLKVYLAELVPPGPWLYPEDQISDAPQRHWAAEVTREKLYLRLHDELPYSSTVETTDWKTLKDGSVRIEQTIYVERDGQKKIVLGAGGATIKTISMLAREEMQEALGGKVHLFLFVKVRGGWGDDPERYREIGLEYPKGD